MKPSETIRLQALKLKQTNQGAHHELIEALLAANPEEAKKGMRNICALVSHQLFEEVESVCNLLGFSKRQVIEMALVEFVKQAHEIIEEVAPFEGLEDEHGTAVLTVEKA